MSRDVILITGATGAVGSWLAREALDAGLTVMALARCTASRSADQRVRESLTTIGTASLQKLIVLEGDISQENLGLNDADLPARPGLVFHAAACTDFHPGAAELNRRTNVDGVQRVLQFAQRHHTSLVHTSTAYVAGRRTELVREDELDVGQSHHNAYERSKCHGEALVRQWAAQTRLPTIILRPSIVVGDWHHGRALRFNTIYDIMHALDAVCPTLNGKGLRVVGGGDVTKNIIPVDYLAAAAWRIIRRGVGGTYHLVHPQPITLAQIRDIMTEIFQVGDLRLVSEDEYASHRPTQAERVFRRVASAYQPYMMHREPVFDQSATIAALADIDLHLKPLDAAYFRRLLAYARHRNWGRPARNEKPSRPVDEYFTVFLADKLHRNLLPDLRSLTAQFRIITSDEGHWSLDVRHGVLRSISRNGATPQCTFSVDPKTFLEIVSGRLAPQQAFFNRRAEISGDMETGLRVAAVLAQFFRKFPYEAIVDRAC